MATKPPLIGLPGRRKRASEMSGFPEVFDDRDIDLYFADYARGVMEAGGIPVHLPIEVDPAVVGERLDGIVLPGGTDIDPIRYGAEPHPE
ncbi:MAG: gamma-glutamyl-gamma-aminobutyrate hydrolase family protein, partial [bacterium]|nr:gamma-glutamyl-gamma-aminobutyrate hydrolase family protein [bacterium]